MKTFNIKKAKNNTDVKSYETTTGGELVIKHYVFMIGEFTIPNTPKKEKRTFLVPKKQAQMWFPHDPGVIEITERDNLNHCFYM